MYSFIRTAAAVPVLKVADCVYNTEEIIKLIDEASKKDVKILAFPELSITSYTCGDLFAQSTLIEYAEKSLEKIAEFSKDKDMFITVGLPVCCDNQTFNCIAGISKGKILGLIPKTNLPNYSEFYEERWFSSADDLISDEITICGQTVPIGSDILFTVENIKNLTIGIEVCEDLWSPIPPSSYQSIFGATVIINGSASNELATKHEYRRNLVAQQSSRCICGYIYSSAGTGESTQDTVFSGHSMICENGNMLSESKRFLREGSLTIADIDLELLANDRKKNTSFMTQLRKNEGPLFFRNIKFTMEENSIDEFYRTVKPAPFVPDNNAMLNERCEDIFNIQVTGLAKRITHTNSKSLVVGISGGLDSTLALLVAVKACDYLGIDRKNVHGITMPGFGTTDRTYNNALNLMKSLGVTVKEISIKDAAIQHFKDIGHDINVHDVTYENTQARERTQILMDYANKEWGMVIGTGDLSELALGWATYNGDHMSMYGVNGGVPKTLVRVLVKWVAENENLGNNSAEILFDVLDTPVSPELLPPDKDGNINQKTEEIVGPYELHDFFLYYVVRFGFAPAKILFLAEKAFKGEYSRETLIKWIKNFYRRFFAQQFKRSCLPDGPKVGTISLSPRGDWRMPSDACGRIWLDEAEKL
ncbi:NAD(+) synthase [Tyzzerella sp. An114]|uniref:NAD(+) synthase n=1 Tax=Tyzzerella sp. An114 TaxID=1965545 RepID=UPI000B43AAB3|nr:NAD(+) synthase [Tyzzerella sp. An114]OUQ57149.1 NAD(+) synthase [Tyzzerella sp. An114]